MNVCVKTGLGESVSLTIWLLSWGRLQGRVEDYREEATVLSNTMCEA